MPHHEPVSTSDDPRHPHQEIVDLLAAAFLRLKYGTLAWYRCQGGGPAFVRVGPKLIRYRLGDLREYAKGQPMGEGVQRAAMAMLAARTAKAEG